VGKTVAYVYSSLTSMYITVLCTIDYRQCWSRN